MRIVFVRVPDYQRGYALVTRDDGVQYRLNDGPQTRHIPHDLIHFTAEDAFRVGDGIWAALCGGVVFSSMGHVSGRRLPHAADRSATLIREHRDSLQKAEMIAELVKRAAERDPAARRVQRWLSGRHGFEPAQAEIDFAVRQLRVASEEWARLQPGGGLERTWPAQRRLRLAHEVGRSEGRSKRRHATV
jgi:hypothetical protein